MLKITRLLSKLPIPKSTRLSWQAYLIDRSFRNDMVKLRASKNKDSTELKRLEWENRFEISMINEEQDVLFTKQLIKKSKAFACTYS